MPSYLSIVWNISFNRQSVELEEKNRFYRRRVSVKTKCMIIYLYSACAIYSYTWKDTSIVSIVYIFMKHPNTSKLPCDIPYLLGSVLEVRRSVKFD